MAILTDKVFSLSLVIANPSKVNRIPGSQELG
jgi:hypothetical protein